MKFVVKRCTYWSTPTQAIKCNTVKLHKNGGFEICQQNHKMKFLLHNISKNRLAVLLIFVLSWNNVYKNVFWYNKLSKKIKNHIQMMELSCHCLLWLSSNFSQMILVIPISLTSIFAQKYVLSATEFLLIGNKNFTFWLKTKTKP